MKQDEPQEPELEHSDWGPEPELHFFSEADLAEIWRESQGEDEPPSDPETFEEWVLRCLSSYREYF